MRESNLSVPDADALVHLADALDVTVQELLGMPAESAAPEPAETAAALMRINEQLAIQNRRRRRIWAVVGWLLGVFVAFNALLIVLGWVFTAAPVSLEEGSVVEISAPIGTEE